MTNLASGNHCSWPIGVHEQAVNARCNKVPTYLAYGGTCFPSKRFYSLRGQNLGAGAGAGTGYYCQHLWRHRSACQSVADDGVDPDDSEHDTGDDDEEKCYQGEPSGVDVEILRESLERIAGTNDYAFSGRDLATLIREKYGRSYDVLLIKKEFMGRNLLALNVMWKYVEQRSFPLTEEEYLMRLDDVANTLKCWGAVSHIRSSISKLKERPRIGKAVSIFIDMDESGGRANEWIYK